MLRQDATPRHAATNAKRLCSSYSVTRPGTSTLRERQVHVADGFVDFLRALEADRGAVHAGILESEPHGLHTIVVTMLELAAAAQLHADHSQPFLLQLVNVIDDLAHVIGMVGIFISRPIHARSIVIDPDEPDLKPRGAGHLP